MIMAKQLVRLWQRPTYDGKKYTFYLVYYDVDGRRRQKALGHSDRRKAERQRAQLERELRMGTVEPGSMKLSELLEKSIVQTRGQVRDSTLKETRTAVEHLIQFIGNLDYQQIRHGHGERFLQACLDYGNTPATAVKKLKHLKRFFQLAVDRGQLEENPFKRVRPPKVSRKNVRIYSDDECGRLMKAAREYRRRTKMNWELLIRVALCTGMRRGELLNLTWRDIDFEKKVVYVSPKADTEYTWQWHIKDTDRRTLPLTDEVIQLLVEHQNKQPDGYPYVFVPPFRFDHIQKRREQRSWTVEHGRCPINNFSTRFETIRTTAGIETGEFHDLRGTCLTRWLSNGLSEFEVMNLAGHSKFETTRSFYLAVREDLLGRARSISDRLDQGNFVAKLLQVPSGGTK
jgi:integrase